MSKSHVKLRPIDAKSILAKSYQIRKKEIPQVDKQSEKSKVSKQKIIEMVN